MPPSGVDYASEFLNGYAPEYVANHLATMYLSGRLGPSGRIFFSP